MTENKEYSLHRPPLWKVAFSYLGLTQITPGDICSAEDLDALYRDYPDLAGDQTAIGLGDDGYCQSWQGDKGWWRELVE